MMQRLPDWETRLADYLEPLRLRPFAWGDHDCCTFAAGAVAAMTGIDPMPEFRGRYSTAIGSARALRRFGAGDLPSTMDAKFETIPAPLAQRGDIVMSSGLLGVCMGPYLAAVGSEGAREGLIKIERRAWVAPLAWRVGF
ncbi:DUF6950 family protein [Sphingomonas yabuuchiae]|uniref:DUF6950 domain-containing protein n=1 Tax=Sphingomonas yabuuchiae TaxID=172044 RepID=A0AA40ZXK4_9SPHN|nr:hypothetical protein [Sphingomonas yabuuchiae]MBB4611600.1 hypothetical protein [Sphingomonas yabuuchiae]MBN3556884.1 hypothetical protein [Sphingomonas yabuuchiae]